MALAQTDLPELKRFTFFVSRRFEEGRERFRLHMGYFATLAEAEEWLNVVREIYPGAWAGEAPGKKLRERAAAAAAAQAQHAAGPPPPVAAPRAQRTRGAPGARLPRRACRCACRHCRRRRRFLARQPPRGRPTPPAPLSAAAAFRKSPDPGAAGRTCSARRTAEEARTGPAAACEAPAAGRGPVSAAPQAKPVPPPPVKPPAARPAPPVPAAAARAAAAAPVKGEPAGKPAITDSNVREVLKALGDASATGETRLMRAPPPPRRAGPARAEERAE